jgi:predicted PurR-regulated permease PerM
MKHYIPTLGILAILAALGILLLIDNWHPLRAVIYLIVWAAVATLVIRAVRRRNA